MTSGCMQKWKWIADDNNMLPGYWYVITYKKMCQADDKKSRKLEKKSPQK